MPTSFAGIPFGDSSEEEFIKLLFAIPSTGEFIFMVLPIQLSNYLAAVMCMYHLAHLLLLTEGRNSSLAGEISQVIIANTLCITLWRILTQNRMKWINMHDLWQV